MGASEDEATARRLIESGSLTELVKAGIGLHEMYTSFVKSGFTKDEALTLVAKIICNGPASEDD